MNVFAFTRIKLTAWYVTAIMAVSIMFSIVIYAGITRNIEDVFLRAGMHLRNNPGLTQQVTQEILERQNLSTASSNLTKRDVLEQFFIDELVASKRKVFHNLLFANFLILVLSSIVSYVLASKTLRPIEETVLEQKRFIADASHELRTPLTSLKTAIEVSLRDKSLNKKAKKILSENLEDVDALKDLIDSLLQLASQESKTVVKQLVDVQEIMSRALKMVQPLAEAKNITLTTNLLHQQLLSSEADLQQLFTILLDNAIKYSNQKGEVSVRFSKQKRCLTVVVSDTGIGINKKYLPYIFDRFYRIDSSRTSSQRPGFGLGLSVAQQIVQNHAGEISVSSEIGKGTTFTVTFPI